MNFSYFQPTELIFGEGKIKELHTVVKRYGSNVLLVAPYMNVNIKAMYDNVLTDLSNKNINIITFFKVESDPSIKTVIEAIKIFKANKIDVIVGMGGGSSIDVAKSIALLHDNDIDNIEYVFKKYERYVKGNKINFKNKFPLIAIPTTAGTGSQCSQASVIKDNKTGLKLTLFSENNYPNISIIDPSLTLTLPRSITVSTAFDAFSHAFESYLRNESDLISEQFSLMAIKNIVEYLPKVLNDNSISNREKLSIADIFAGISLSNNGAMLPHPISEVIGSFINNISHGEALALVYPYFIKYTYKKYKNKYSSICKIFNKKYECCNDEECAKNFSDVMIKFLSENNLYKRINDYTDDINVIKKIKEFPLWEKLKMEETEIILKIINDICESREAII